MAKSILLLVAFMGILAAAWGCSSPTVETKTFTTQDATVVTHIAYISEFTVQCASGSLTNIYAEIDGNVVPVAVVGTNKFQISWTEDTKTAHRGDKTVRIFDEDGYTAYRKASRAGEDTSAIQSLTDVVVNHPGAFNGPFFKSEFLAAILSVVIAYIAINSRSKLSS